MKLYDTELGYTYNCTLIPVSIISFFPTVLTAIGDFDGQITAKQIAIFTERDQSLYIDFKGINGLANKISRVG